MTLALTSHPDSQRSLDRLNLPAYSIAEAAKWAGVHPNTIRYWHYGRGGKGAGVVLPGKQRRQLLTYVQLVEVAFVATLRELGVPLRSIRQAHSYLRESMGTDYPFAQAGFLKENLPVPGQMEWKELLAERFAEFDYEHGLATRWHVAGPDSAVVIDARIAFGKPMIRGIKTRAIAGRAKAGGSDDALQRDFGLSAEEVDDALRFEGLKPAA